MNFDKAFEILIGHEGGFTEDSRDRGNWTTGVIGQGQLKGTKYGISAMSYPNEDIKGLTIGRAKEIYKRDYWDKAGCDRVPEALRFDLFDMAVNSGNKAAIQTLQKAVNVKDDGDFGPKTQAAVNAADPVQTLARFNGHRLYFMADLPTWGAFGRGWARRIAKNLMVA